MSARIEIGVPPRNCTNSSTNSSTNARRIRAETAVSAMSVLGWLRRLLYSTIVDGISTIRPKSASVPSPTFARFQRLLATSIRASSAVVNGEF